MMGHPSSHPYTTLQVSELVSLGHATGYTQS
jgi:hypothetical protein